MELSNLLNYLIYGIVAVGGWFLRELWQAVTALREDLFNLQKEIAKDYVPRTEVKDFTNTILSAIHELRRDFQQHELRVIKELNAKVDK